MSHASASNRVAPSATALVGGAIAIAILRLLMRKKLLSVEEARRVLKTAQRSLSCSPAMTGSIDGAAIIAEVAELLTGG